MRLIPGIVAVVIGLSQMALGATETLARDDGRYAASPLHEWIDGLKSGKGPCCSFADGETVADPDWKAERGHYQVKIEEEWVDVPDDALITEPNLIGRTMVWPFKYLDGSKHIRCFMPGSMS